MILAKISIDRPILTTMVLLVFMIFGYIAFRGMNMNQIPEVNIPFVTISTIYPGAGPKEIETQISKRIEDVVATVSQIKRIESYSLDGVSIVMLEFDLNKDIDIATQEVKDKVDQVINLLPRDVDKPIVQKVDLQAFPVIDVVFSGDLDPLALYDYASRTLKDRFSQIGGVAQVNIIGGQQREIKVSFDDKTVYENMISLPQMLQIFAAQNFDIPGGYFQIQGQEYTVRLSGEFDDLDQIKETELETPFGKKKIGHIADVIDGGKKVRQRAVYFDNIAKVRDENVVRLSLIKATDGNAINISKDLYKLLPELEAIIPEGTQLKVVNDAAEFTEATVDDTMSNILLGILFTSIVLLLFLHDIRSTIIVGLSMPISVVSTFLLMKAAGFSLNMMSLMGISVSIGVLVANSIVVLENIFRNKEKGMNRKDAAYFGTKQVTVAVVASTLTNIVVFVPLANISSIVGEFLKEMALTATFATIFSLIISFTLTPMLASLILPDKPKIGFLSRKIIAFEKMWERVYTRLLTFGLKNKWISVSILAITFIMFFITVFMIYGPKLSFEFMPAGDNGKIAIQVQLPEGYDLPSTTKLMQTIEDRIRTYDDVEVILTNIGKTDDLNIGTNLAMMEVYLKDVAEREVSLNGYIESFTEELASIPNALIKVSPLENMAGPGAPIEFYLLGQDLDKLEEIKAVIVEKAKNIEGLVNFDNSSSAGKPEMTVKPNRQKITELGVSVQEIGMTLRAAIEGIVSTQYKDRGEEYDMVITMDEESVNTPEKIAAIPIITRMGTYRLSDLAEVEFTKGFTKVLRRDKFTAIKFTGEPATGVPTGDLINEINLIVDGGVVDGKEIAGLDLPPGYRVKWGGSAEMQIQMVSDLAFAFLLAIVLTYMLLAAILESLWQPALIMLTIPLALIGVVILMYYTDTYFGLTAIMGVIMLIGIVVNNAILILDQTNYLIRDEKMKVKDALIKAAPEKLKPIIMSTTAIILGLLPMALGIGSAGKEMRIPLGIVSIGGLVASTFLTLFVIPVAFYVVAAFFNRVKLMFAKMFGREVTA